MTDLDTYRATIAVDARLDAYKASFGGDRSAAGRYAAEQRWKGHQKKGDKPTGGRTTDQKLAEGPTNLLFGRDANGMPVMGGVKELKTRYGKSAEAREEYFRTKYGVKLKIKPVKAGSVAEAVQMGVLQALEELCLSTNLDSQILRGVSVGDTGGDPNYEKEANGWYNNGYVTVKPETIEKRLGDLLSKLHGMQLSRGVGLKPSTKEDEDWYGDEAMSNIPLYSTSQMLPSIPALAQDLKPYFSTDPTKQPPSRKDLYSQMAQRAGYAVMVHEFGHAVDFGGSTQGESVSTQAGEEWDKLRAPTQYGRSNLYEKAAESFAAWWLFGGGQGNLPKGIAGIGRLADPILRPILEARGDLVKNATPPIDIATLPFDHPVVQFILAPLLNPALQKARIRVDAMIAAALSKASFGGDRSAAGRYAAEQRWKNHKKTEPKTEPRKLSQTDMLDVHEDMMGRQEEVIKKADIPNEAHRAYQLYPTSAHAAMNQVLRGQKVEGMWVSETIRPEVAAKALKDNFDKMAIETPEPLVVYRGIPNGEDVVGIIEGGTEFEDAGLISTSLSADFAREFGDGTGTDIIFTITVPKGTKVLVPKGPYWEREREVVLRPDTKFKVKEVLYYGGEYGKTAEVICEVVNE